jgi:hypothetical protein
MLCLYHACLLVIVVHGMLMNIDECMCWYCISFFLHYLLIGIKNFDQPKRANFRGTQAVEPLQIRALSKLFWVC